MGRPPITYGIWTGMVEQAGSVEALAMAVAISRQHLQKTFTGTRNLPGPSRKLAEAFAREHGILARLYIHPRLRGHFLVSAADGWWTLRAGAVWGTRVPAIRMNGEDWRILPGVELPFSRLTEKDRKGSITESRGGED